MTARSRDLFKAIGELIKGNRDVDVVKMGEQVNAAELLFIQELIELNKELTGPQQVKLGHAIERYFIDELEDASSR